MHTTAIVHGSPPVREGLAELLGRQPGLRVVGTHPSLAAMREAATTDAGVVLCDLAAAMADTATADAAVAEGAARLLVFNVADEDRTIIDLIVFACGRPVDRLVGFSSAGHVRRWVADAMS